MRKRLDQQATMNQKRLLDSNELCIYLSLGKNKSVEFAESINAKIKVGKRALYDREKIDVYLNSQTVTD